MSMNMDVQGTGGGDDEGSDNSGKRKTDWQQDQDEPQKKKTRTRRTSSTNQRAPNPYAKTYNNSLAQQSKTGSSRNIQTRWDTFGADKQAVEDEKKRKADEQKDYEDKLADEYKNRTRAPLGESGDGQLHIVFIQMGQGDCAIISTPEGRSILVDGGTTATEEDSDQAYNDRVRSILRGPKFLKDKNKLDMLILTHPDRDHYAKIKAILTGIVSEIGVFYHSCKFNGYNFNETSTWIDNILGDNAKRANKQVTCCDDEGEKQFRQVKPRGNVTYPIPHQQMPNEQLDARGAIRILREPTPKQDATATTTSPGSTQTNTTPNTTPMNVNTATTTNIPGSTQTNTTPVTTPNTTPMNVDTVHTAASTAPTNVAGSTQTDAHPTVGAVPSSSTPPQSASTHGSAPSLTLPQEMIIPEDMDIDIDLNIDLNVDLDPDSSPVITSPPPLTLSSTPIANTSSSSSAHTVPMPQTTTTTTTTIASTTCSISILASNVFTESRWRDDNTNNKRSVVLLIEAYGRSIMISGDATGGTEEFIMRAYPDVKDLDVLQVPHHGSDRTSSTLKFVAVMNPENCIISAPKDARQHGHPCSSVITAYRKNTRMRRDVPEHTIYYKERDEDDKTQKSSVVEKITDAVYITGSYGSCALTVTDKEALTISTLEVAAQAQSSTSTTTRTDNSSSTTPMQITADAPPQSQPTIIMPTQTLLTTQPQTTAQPATIVPTQTPSTAQPQPQPITVVPTQTPQTTQPQGEPMSLDTPDKS